MSRPVVGATIHMNIAAGNADCLATDQSNAEYTSALARLPDLERVPLGTGTCKASATITIPAVALDLDDDRDKFVELMLVAVVWKHATFGVSSVAWAGGDITLPALGTDLALPGGAKMNVFLINTGDALNTGASPYDIVVSFDGSVVSAAAIATGFGGISVANGGAAGVKTLIGSTAGLSMPIEEWVVPAMADNFIIQYAGVTGGAFTAGALPSATDRTLGQHAATSGASPDVSIFEFYKRQSDADEYGFDGLLPSARQWGVFGGYML